MEKWKCRTCGMMFDKKPKECPSCRQTDFEKIPGPAEESAQLTLAQVKGPDDDEETGPDDDEETGPDDDEELENLDRIERLHRADVKPLRPRAPRGKPKPQGRPPRGARKKPFRFAYVFSSAVI